MFSVDPHRLFGVIRISVEGQSNSLRTQEESLISWGVHPRNILRLIGCAKPNKPHRIHQSQIQWEVDKFCESLPPRSTLVFCTPCRLSRDSLFIVPIIANLYMAYSQVVCLSISIDPLPESRLPELYAGFYKGQVWAQSMELLQLQGIQRKKNSEKGYKGSQKKLSVDELAEFIVDRQKHKMIRGETIPFFQNKYNLGKASVYRYFSLTDQFMDVDINKVDFDCLNLNGPVNCLSLTCVPPYNSPYNAKGV